MLNGVPDDLAPAPDDVMEYWKRWLDQDGYPWWSFWENIRTWWEIRNLPNVLFLHFADMKRDLAQTIRRIAEFLDIKINESRWDVIMEHCSFAWMKNDGSDKILPGIEDVWEEGAKTFINKGSNGRWKNVLTQEESLAYEERAVEELGEECAAWLKNGGKIE